MAADWERSISAYLDEDSLKPKIDPSGCVEMAPSREQAIGFAAILYLVTGAGWCSSMPKAGGSGHQTVGAPPSLAVALVLLPM